MDVAQTGAQIGGGVLGAVSYLLVILIVVAIFAFLYMGGYFGTDYKLIIKEIRGNSFKIKEGKGRRGKDGKLEIIKGLFGVARTEMAEGNQIQYPNYIFLSQDGDKYQVLNVNYQNNIMTSEPALSNAMVVVHANETRKAIERYSQPNPLEKFIMPISLFLAAILMLAGFYIGFGQVATAMEKVAGAQEHLASTLSDKATQEETKPQDPVTNPLDLIPGNKPKG